MRRMMIGLFAVGCSYESYYPEFNGVIVVDTGGPNTPFADRFLTPECSRPDEGTQGNLKVINNLGVTALVSQVNENCQETVYTEMGPGDVFENRFGNHIMWTARRATDEKLLVVFGMPSGTNVSWVETLD